MPIPSFSFSSFCRYCKRFFSRTEAIYCQRGIKQLALKKNTKLTLIANVWSGFLQVVAITIDDILYSET